MYAPRPVLREMQTKFFPSLCADGGPVADAEVGTIGHGLFGVSFLILCFWGWFSSFPSGVSTPRKLFWELGTRNGASSASWVGEMGFVDEPACGALSLSESLSFFPLPSAVLEDSFLRFVAIVMEGRRAVKARRV